MGTGQDALRTNANGSADYGALVAAVAEVATVVDLEGVVRFVSASCERVFGWAPEALVGRPETAIVHPDDISAVQQTRAELVSGMSISTDYRLRCADGSYRWVEARSTRVTAGDSELIVTALHDINDRRKRTMELEYLATTDPLTGVANRTVLMDRLRRALLRLARSPGVVAVLYLDLDDFKAVNDSLGHGVGDEVLSEMAARLMQHLRPTDTLARLGGDEFVIVAEGVFDEGAALGLADRVIDEGRKPFRVGGDEFECTVSVGVTFTANSQRSAEDLLAESDLALYRAKHLGRNRSKLFNAQMRTAAVGQVAVERMLQRALEEDRVVVEYQPIIDLASGRPVAAEALVRIDDPQEGLLLPQSFLQVAQETGRLIAIDALVLADAVAQAARWNVQLRGSDFAGVAINVTAHHLADLALSESIADRLDALGVPRHHLRVEVTERVLIEASSSAMSTLRALRGVGIQIGLDDFGTGYSSIAYLRQFPLDFVKLDKLLIDGIEGDQRQRAVVGGVITLCHALDLTVVAEGVERSGQAEILSELGCDRAQGFLYAAPASPAAIDELVRARSTA
jgi:diguanylate cyclase (GGDEF)-like protein/PAS domain S-box-containing protein